MDWKRMPKASAWNAERAREIIAEHIGLEGPMMPILHGLLEEFGCVSKEAVPLIADALNLTRAEVHGVITFYHDFRSEPCGPHLLQLCRGVEIWAARARWGRIPDWHKMEDRRRHSGQPKICCLQRRRRR
jgi:NADH:ubiquinone oxidoreductase subunit E